MYSSDVCRSNGSTGVLSTNLRNSLGINNSVAYSNGQTLRRSFQSVRGIFSALCELAYQSFHWYYNGNNILHYSVVYQNYDAIEAHASTSLINGVNCYGETALMLASRSNMLPAVQLLVGHGANVDITDFKGKNALHHASDGIKTVQIAEYFIENGIDPTALDHEGNTGIHLSAKSGNFKVLKLLHSFHVPFDNFNAEGQTPLMNAALHKNVKIVKFLVSQGSDIKKRKASHFKSVFECALMGKNNAIIDFFIQQSPKSSELPVDSSKTKNAYTSLFEKIIRNIDKVEFENIFSNKRWEKNVVHIDETSVPLLDIFREVQWELIHFNENDYELLKKRLGLHYYSFDYLNDNLEKKMQIRLELEQPEDRESLRNKFNEKYQNLNNIDKYLIHQATGILSRHMNEVLAGCKPAGGEVPLNVVIMKIAFFANALNKIGPENVNQFTCRGQADIYKENQNNAPLFISVSKNYQVCEDYVKMGGVVCREGGGKGHKVFFKKIVGYDISGLSSVPTALEYITMPRVISYTDECFANAPDSQFPAYYFGLLNKTSSDLDSKL